MRLPCIISIPFHVGRLSRWLVCQCESCIYCEWKENDFKNAVDSVLGFHNLQISFVTFMFAKTVQLLLIFPVNNLRYCGMLVVREDNSEKWHTLRPCWYRVSGSLLHQNWSINDCLTLLNLWSLYEIIHICTAVVDESEMWSSQ